MSSLLSTKLNHGEIFLKERLYTPLLGGKALNFLHILLFPPFTGKFTRLTEFIRNLTYKTLKTKIVFIFLYIFINIET